MDEPWKHERSQLHRVTHIIPFLGKPSIDKSIEMGSIPVAA